MLSTVGNQEERPLAHEAGVKLKIFHMGRGLGNDYLQVNIRGFQYISSMHGNPSVVQLNISLAPKRLCVQCSVCINEFRNALRNAKGMEAKPSWSLPPHTPHFLLSVVNLGVLHLGRSSHQGVPGLETGPGISYKPESALPPDRPWLGIIEKGKEKKRSFDWSGDREGGSPAE